MLRNQTHSSALNLTFKRDYLRLLSILTSIEIVQKLEAALLFRWVAFSERLKSCLLLLRSSCLLKHSMLSKFLNPSGESFSSNLKSFT